MQHTSNGEIEKSKTDSTAVSSPDGPSAVGALPGYGSIVLRVAHLVDVTPSLDLIRTRKPSRSSSCSRLTENCSCFRDRS